MMQIRLKAKTNKGKTIIKQYGDVWYVLKRKDRVEFSNEKGPWLFIDIDPNSYLSTISRWVNVNNDPNFEVKYDGF